MNLAGFKWSHTVFIFLCWLLSLSTVSSRLIHAAVCVRISFLFKVESFPSNGHPHLVCPFICSWTLGVVFCRQYLGTITLLIQFCLPLNLSGIFYYGFWNTESLENLGGSLCRYIVGTAVTISWMRLQVKFPPEHYLLMSLSFLFWGPPRPLGLVAAVTPVLTLVCSPDCFSQLQVYGHNW